MPLDQAARTLHISQPSFYDQDSSKLQNYINEVNQKAIGHQFTGTLTDNGNTTEITYQIVGLLPHVGPTNIESSSVNLLENILSTLMPSPYSEFSFIVTNPNSHAFKSSYSLNTNQYNSHTVVSFNNIKNAEKFLKNNGCKEADHCTGISISEFISNQTYIRAINERIDGYIIVFIIIFTVFSAIIMAGTVSRVISDEHSSIALYRTVGATTKNILQIFTSYILTLSFFIVICSAIIGILLATLTTLTNTPLITANASAMYNVANPSSIILIGFDPRILLVFLTVITVSSICLLLVIDKLTSKNIVKNLRK
ncbi:MAG: hypothetical protein LBT19_00820 [Candidatus Nomurabacteria bacterium]|jgi:ABC-type antimicrobial peptide transport system permease subunit|nr:hypothetical protein [Candidatus Nomurabacteria bacterium]